ncbi:MAG TPA: GNAT family N-acetyltransferase [Acidiphilium sp.]|uniref:GNAT family N-acetyltransferase n=1 Tax=unclassified Acidiphilium TaxID=2617493 RepID=UPI000BC74835|nr:MULTISPECIES: GNAT family N-acetyltransferase [unclassified Acidiphilium]OYV55959.1 MAG: GNAT family N-acetyltransferase [Acidiphilium sp. 20-67-58]HQT61563.1 GNAT family N-acetyltransferase [Acidiphilium sp.]HQU09995.1 GNAT family N-acetyltransferase [Acidiphilium sp.]
MTETIVHLTAGADDLADWLGRCEALHRVLRPHLPTDYEGTMRRILAGGAEMALLHEAGVPRALAVFRAFHDTANGYRFYIDDLVTDAPSRSAGHGAALLGWCEAEARRRGCTRLTLESGTHRERAHRFYFREGLAITLFGFAKTLD